MTTYTNVRVWWNGPNSLVSSPVTIVTWTCIVCWLGKHNPFSMLLGKATVSEWVEVLLERFESIVLYSYTMDGCPNWLTHVFYWVYTIIIHVLNCVDYVLVCSGKQVSWKLLHRILERQFCKGSSLLTHLHVYGVVPLCSRSPPGIGNMLASMVGNFGTLYS